MLKSSKKEIFKIVIAGDGGTGKSTLVRTKLTREFDYSSPMTIGIDFHVLRLTQKVNQEINEKNQDEQNKITNFLVFDLGGQERFKFMHKDYIRGARGAFILYDLTRLKTFDHVKYWYSLLTEANPEIAIILVGSKLDLIEKRETIPFIQKWKELSRTGDFPNILAHHFISSKENIGIDELFDKLSEYLKNQTLTRVATPYIRNLPG